MDQRTPKQRGNNFIVLLPISYNGIHQVRLSLYYVHQTFVRNSHSLADCQHKNTLIRSMSVKQSVGCHCLYCTQYLSWLFCCWCSFWLSLLPGNVQTWGSCKAHATKVLSEECPLFRPFCIYLPKLMGWPWKDIIYTCSWKNKCERLARGHKKARSNEDNDCLSGRQALVGSFCPLTSAMAKRTTKYYGRTQKRLYYCHLR